MSKPGEPTPQAEDEIVERSAFEAPLHIGGVTLVVQDLDKVAAFYAEAVGLELLSQNRQTAVLGVSGQALVTLHGDPAARRESPQQAGLFHTAFLLPGRPALGAWLADPARGAIRFTGMSDHTVSEAIYFNDPEDNGIEVYADRPRAGWLTAAGEIDLTTTRLDRPSLLAAGRILPATLPKMPAGSGIGHIHLRVGDVDHGATFLRDGLGLELMASRPQARFMSTGGYHHHVAVNTWESRGAGPRSPGLTGLAAYHLIARDEAVRDQTAARLKTTGARTTEEDGGVTATDPWGTAIEIRVAA